MRVVTADDHPTFLAGLRAVLAAAPDLALVGEAATGAEAVALARELRPDVVVMDVRLGGDSGIEATRELRARRPSTRVIMLTSFADDDAMFSSIMAGASGYVLKQIAGNDLVAAVRTVASGQSLLDPIMTNAVLERLRQGRDQLKDEKLSRLSAQEERILTLVAEGKTNKEIGQELHVSEKTVKNHLSHILQKLGVARRAEAAAYLTRHQRSGDS